MKKPPISMPLDRDLIAHNVKMLRALDGLTATEFAKRAGIDRTTLYYIETGRPVRFQTLLRICDAFDISLEMVISARQTLNIKSAEQPFVLHLPEQTVWYAWGDRRRVIPENNQELIQDPAERMRLGTNGMVPVFVSSASFIMPEGPGVNLLEIYGTYTTGVACAIYRTSVMRCIQGEVVVSALGETIHMRPGSMIGYDNHIEWEFRPVRPVVAGEPPPTLVWTGANRLGRVEILQQKRKGKQIPLHDYRTYLSMTGNKWFSGVSVLNRHIE